MSEGSYINHKYPNLPNAPLTFEVPSFASASPYHVACESIQQQSFVMAGIKNMACLFVAERSKFAKEKLDFSIESFRSVDALLEEFCRVNPQPTWEQMETFVSQCGAYVGSCLEYHFQFARNIDARWHPSFPKYYFSSFRFPVTTQSGQVLIETSPFSVVTRRLVQLLEDDGGECQPSLVEYARKLIG